MGLIGAKEHMYGMRCPFVLCLWSSLTQPQQAASWSQTVEHGKKQLRSLMGIVMAQLAIAHGLFEPGGQSLQNRAATGLVQLPGRARKARRFGNQRATQRGRGGITGVFAVDHGQCAQASFDIVGTGIEGVMQRLDQRLDGCTKQRVLVVKVGVYGLLGHACALGYRIHADAIALVQKQLASRIENARIGWGIGGHGHSCHETVPSSIELGETGVNACFLRICMGSSAKKTAGNGCWTRRQGQARNRLTEV